MLLLGSKNVAIYHWNWESKFQDTWKERDKGKNMFFYINRFIIIIIVSTLSLVLFCIRIAFDFRKVLKLLFSLRGKVKVHPSVKKTLIFSICEHELLLLSCSSCLYFWICICFWICIYLKAKGLFSRWYDMMICDPWLQFVGFNRFNLYALFTHITPP